MKFSGQRTSAQDNVKKNVNGPRFSSFANSSPRAFFQYRGVFLIFSNTMYGSSNVYTDVPSGFTFSSLF